MRWWPADSVRLARWWHGCIRAPRLLPPMQQCAWTLRNSPSARMFFSVCAASSRVGLSTSACTLREHTRRSQVRNDIHRASVSLASVVTLTVAASVARPPKCRVLLGKRHGECTDCAFLLAYGWASETVCCLSRGRASRGRFCVGRRGTTAGVAQAQRRRLDRQAADNTGGSAGT